jgi:hypothetical protein
MPRGVSQAPFVLAEDISHECLEALGGSSVLGGAAAGHVMSITTTIDIDRDNRSQCG